MLTVAVGCVVWWVGKTYSRDHDGLLMQVVCDAAGRKLVSHLTVNETAKVLEVK